MLRLLPALLLLSPAPATGQEGPAPESPAPEDPLAPVLAEVETIHGEDGLRNASVGFALLPLDSEEPAALAGYHADTALLPASTLKAVTTATALELLGVDFRFTTALQHTGTVTEEGTLKGDLIIKGGGDPTLGASRITKTFAPWREALKKAGIRKIEGRVVGDATVFGSQMRPDSWQWNDLGNYYAAGACGLTFHRNQFYCRFQTGEVGTPAPLLFTDPKLPDVQFVNEMRVGAPASGDQGYVFGAPYSKLLYLRGTVPAGGPHFTIRGSLPDPAYFCARAFSLHLAKNEIEVTGEPTTVRLLTIAGGSLGERTDLLEEKSEALPRILTIINHRSDNLYAECVHRMMGVVCHEEGSTKAGSRAVTAHWKSKGIDLTGFAMADGCGLSRVNAITARQLVLVLRHAAQSEHFEIFYKSLPVAGRSGTLRNIGLGTDVEGRVRAKSGSIERVKSYCGYLDTKSGKRYAFALLINNYTCDLAALKAKIIRVWNTMAAL